jgi:hypothetical protein
MVKPLAQAPNLDDIAKFTVSGGVGDVVYKEGDTGKDMFIIQEGKIEIQLPKAAESLKPALLGPGDFFGELAVFEDQRRDTTAKGVTAYRLLRIDRTTLDQLVQENPEIAVRMLYRLASRLREHEEALRRASEIAAGAMNPILAKQAMASAIVQAPAAATGRREIGRTSPGRAGSGGGRRIAEGPHEGQAGERTPDAANRGPSGGAAHPRRVGDRIRSQGHERGRPLRSRLGLHS